MPQHNSHQPYRAWRISFLHCVWRNQFYPTSNLLKTLVVNWSRIKKKLCKVMWVRDKKITQLALSVGCMK
jgi:hypothetical protein